MSVMHEIVLIAGMVAVTFSVRFLVLLLAGRLSLPIRVIRALRYVPVAVLTAIAVPMLVKPAGHWALTFENAHLLAGLIAIATAAIYRRLLLTIVVGMTTFLLLHLN